MKNKPTICMLVLNGVISDPRVTKEAESLSKEYKVIVVGCGDENLDGREDKRTYEIILASLPPRRYHHNRWRNVFSAISHKCRGIMGIYRTASKLKADVYHAHDFEMLPCAAILSRKKKVKCVYDSHELWAEQRADFPSLFKKVVRLFEGFYLKRCDAVITVNESIATELKRRYNIAVNIYVIRNFAKYSANAPEQSVNTRSRERVVLLYHGGYMKDRGLKELILAVDHMDKRVNVQLRGMGAYEEELKALACSQESADRIQFCDPVPMTELVAAAGSADIGIIPYQPTCLNNLYSLPNKFSEYAMAGLAICVSDLPELRSLNERMHFGELFDPYDPESIAEAVNRMVREESALDNYKQNVKQWSIEEGNWETEQQYLLALYSSIL